MEQQNTYVAGCCFCYKYRAYILFYGLITIILNMMTISYNIILSYNIKEGTIELRLLNKSLLLNTNTHLPHIWLNVFYLLRLNNIPLQRPDNIRQQSFIEIRLFANVNGINTTKFRVK